jgi:hypothetical protein
MRWMISGRDVAAYNMCQHVGRESPQSRAKLQVRKAPEARSGHPRATLRLEKTESLGGVRQADVYGLAVVLNRPAYFTVDGSLCTVWCVASGVSALGFGAEMTWHCPFRGVSTPCSELTRETFICTLSALQKQGLSQRKLSSSSRRRHRLGSAEVGVDALFLLYGG